METIGLFSGVGGIELGFRQAGIKTIWATEIDEKAIATYKMNHDNKIVQGDIHHIPSGDIPDADIILAGFPCQAFSIAGYRKGFEDERGNVFFQLARVIRDKRPSFVFIENVKNLVGHDQGNTYKVIRETLENYGYYLRHRVLNASEYANVPQNRERVYMIGFLNKAHYDRFSFPDQVELTKTIHDIVDIDKKVDDKYYYNERNFKRFNEIENVITDSNTLYQWRRVYVRKNKSQLCPTLTANMGTGGHNVPLIKTKHGIRKLTPKECFLFQGYPEDFRLPPLAPSALYKQAGNSVVVPLIRRLAENIIKAVKESE